MLPEQIYCRVGMKIMTRIREQGDLRHHNEKRKIIPPRGYCKRK